MPQVINKYHGLPVPRFARNLMANPAAFLAATLGLILVLGIKVFVERQRPVHGHED